MLSVQQLVVGIFRNRIQTELALNELHQVGFDNRHIRVAKHGISIGGIVEQVQSWLEEQDIPAARIYNDLVDMGMPPEDALYYQREFKAGRSIVAVLRSGAPLVATSILARNGGYIVNEHFAEFINYYGQGTSVQEPTTEDVNEELDDTNESIAPYADYDQDNAIQEEDKDVINV